MTPVPSEWSKNMCDFSERLGIILPGVEISRHLGRVFATCLEGPDSNILRNIFVDPNMYKSTRLPHLYLTAPSYHHMLGLRCMAVSLITFLFLEQHNNCTSVRKVSLRHLGHHRHITRQRVRQKTYTKATCRLRLTRSGREYLNSAQ